MPATVRLHFYEIYHRELVQKDNDIRGELRKKREVILFLPIVGRLKVWISFFTHYILFFSAGN